MMTNTMILPGATIGMLGGGQLGRMFTTAAQTLGYNVVVLDPDTNSLRALLPINISVQNTLMKPL